MPHVGQLLGLSSKWGKKIFFSFVWLNLGTNSLLRLQNCFCRGDFGFTFLHKCAHLGVWQLGGTSTVDQDPLLANMPSPALALASVEGCPPSFTLCCPKQAPGRCHPLQLFSWSCSLLLSASPTRNGEDKSSAVEQMQLPFITLVIFFFSFLLGGGAERVSSSLFLWFNAAFSFPIQPPFLCPAFCH